MNQGCYFESNEQMSHGIKSESAEVPPTKLRKGSENSEWAEAAVLSTYIICLRFKILIKILNDIVSH